MDGKLVQIADLNQQPDGKITVKIFEEVMRDIIKANHLASKRVVVICTAGPSRTGKSFLLNLVLHFARHKESKSKTEWMNCDAPIKGINWTKSPRPVTHGVWIWNKPLKCYLKNNKKVSILLMDTQGLNAEYQSEKMDNLLLTITLQLHDLLIYNVMGPIRNTDISIISNLLKTWSAKMEIKPIFNHLLFLLRDWRSDSNFDYRPNMFKEKVEETKNDPRNCWKYESIDKAFNNVAGFTTPYPGEKIERASEVDNIKLNDVNINIEFKVSMQKLLEMIFGYGKKDEYFTNIQTDAVSGIEFLEKVQTLKKWMEDEKWVNEDEEIASLYLFSKCESIFKLWDEECQRILEQDLEAIFKNKKTFVPPDKAPYRKKLVTEAGGYVGTSGFSKFANNLDEQMKNSEEEYLVVIEKIKSFKSLKEVHQYLKTLQQGALDSENASKAKIRLKIFASVAGVCAAGAVAAGLTAILGPFAILGTVILGIGAGVSGVISLTGIGAAIKEALQLNNDNGQ